MYYSKIKSIEEVAQNSVGEPETTVTFGPISFSKQTIDKYYFRNKPKDLLPNAIIYFTEDEKGYINYEGSIEAIKLSIYIREFPILSNINLITATVQTISEDFKIITKKSFYGVFDSEELIKKEHYKNLEENILENDISLIIDDLEMLEKAVKTHAMVKEISPYKNDLVSRDPKNPMKINNAWREKENPWIKITYISPYKDSNVTPKYLQDFYDYIVEETGINNLFQYIDQKD